MKLNESPFERIKIDMYNYKIAEVAHEIDRIDFNQLTPIDALNTLVKIKEKLS